MFWSKADREQERFYLLPGMGGRAARRKHAYFLKWSVVVAVALSALLGLAMYLINRLGE